MKRSGYAWSVVALLWVVAALNYLDRQVIYTLFPLLQSDLHVTSIQLGLLGTAFLWVYAAVSPLGGFVADRFSRRAVILLSLCVWSVVTLLLGAAKTYPQLLILQGLMGISEACYIPAALALIADYHGSNTRSRAIGLHQSGLYAGVALGGFLGGWIGQQYGWHHVFYIFGIFGLIYLVILTFWLKEAPVHTRAAAAGRGRSMFAWFRELLSISSFWILALATSLSAVAFWCVYSWLALFLFERFHVTLATAGFSSTFYTQAASLAGVLFGGWLADRWSRSSPGGRIFTQIVGFSLAAPALFLVGFTGSWSLLIACLIVFGLGRGFWDANLMPVLCQMTPEELRATGYGVLNMMSCLAGGLMVVIGGAIKEHFGLSSAMTISAAALLGSVVCLVILSLRRSELNTNSNYMPGRPAATPRQTAPISDMLAIDDL